MMLYLRLRDHEFIAESLCYKLEVWGFFLEVQSGMSPKEEKLMISVYLELSTHVKHEGNKRKLTFLKLMAVT